MGPNCEGRKLICPRRDYLEATNHRLREALLGMLSIAEVWETVDGRKNIQLDNSETVQRARAILNGAE